MMLQKLVLVGAVVAASSSMLGCVYGGAGEDEDVSEARQAVGPTGENDLDPKAINNQILAQGVTDYYDITSSSSGVVDPLQLCQSSTVTSGGCTMRSEWESWMTGHGSWGQSLFKGIVKCAAASSFTVQNAEGTLTFEGQWAVFPSWETHRLQGTAAHEHASSCILTLLNGNNESLQLGILGPGGSPYSNPISDPNLTVREGGYFGDLFRPSPTAYVVGPQNQPQSNNGRACYSDTGTYCCPENETCTDQNIVLAGAMTGPDSRCNGFATSGSDLYCTSFWTTREPGYSYSNVFTTFIPPAP
jgi:hypothetical protein